MSVLSEGERRRSQCSDHTVYGDEGGGTWTMSGASITDNKSENVGRRTCELHEYEVSCIIIRFI